MVATDSRITRALPAIYSFVLAAAVLAPLVRPGYLLLRDAVSTPRSYLTDSSLGLADAAPRAVPQDALIAALSHVVDGGVVVKVLLFAALWLAGWGGAALARTVLNAGTGPQIVAATVMIWNPYVAERLLQGHWSLLAGYAALPWTVRACVDIRTGAGRPAWCALAVCLAAAGLTPTGALLAFVTALVVLVWPGSHPLRLLWLVVLTALASGPWLLATFLSGSGTESSDPAGIAAFAARAEPGLGTLGSLAGLGGIWNSTAVPETRTGLFALFGTLLLLAVVVAGLPALWRRRGESHALLALAVAAVVLSAFGATGWGLDLGKWAVENLPGWGLMRDTQKWVALAVPLYALAAAAGAVVLQRKFGSISAWVPALLVLVALPDLVWGVGGKLEPVTYPDSWGHVAADLENSPDDGDVAVLPTGMFRKFPYSGSAPVLDPAPRMLPRDVLQTGELPVAGAAVRGEGSRAEAVEGVLRTGGKPDLLAKLGVRWVLVERTSAGPVGDSARTLDGLPRVYEDRDLALYRIDGDVADHRASDTDRAIVIAAHVLWALLLVGGLLGQLGRRASINRDDPRPT